MARLPRLIGRGRALEVLLGADDIRADVAELYGYVNRTLPDGELDAFVDGLAMRIASFDRQAIADIKRLVNIASLPPDIDIAPEWDAFIDSVGRPAAQTRIRALKSQCTGRKVISSLTQLRQMIVSHMRQLQKLPLLVRSFFHAPLCVRLSGNYFAKLN